MRKKKILLGIIILCLIAIVLFIVRPPGEFLTKIEIQEKLAKSMYHQKAKDIQDVLVLDKKHVFVPFISMDNTYGGTFWIWTYKGWELASVETKLAPKIWKLDEKRSNKHFIVWNINPKDAVEKLELRLLKKRNYHITDGVHYYTPAIHMLFEQKIEENSYGAIRFPDEWVTVMDNDQKQMPKKPLGLFQPFYSTGLYIGWTSYDSNGENVFPESSVNGHGYYFRGPSLDHLMIVDEYELESY
ncbi:hypothetical protein [Peribacillus acanthi]|uniref:hypothetical protein n=1 Tax=Peribacillus acanthi TaxID=2171554 RepID=UPI000D3E166D|nr:hypothetical protein [Peribacillus acanthi]